MTKYFIEDREGRWLTNPDNPGETWTRDPMKALALTYHFKNRDPYESLLILMGKELPELIVTEHEYQNIGPDRTTWKHQIQKSRLPIYPQGTTHYLTMYHKGVCITNNSGFNFHYNQGIITK